MSLPGVPPRPAVLPYLEPRQSQPSWAGDFRNYRDRLFVAWDNETIYHGPLDAPPEDATRSRGQCGVTSAWLVEQLRDRYGVADLFYCYGHVLLDGQELLSSHCWVEVGDQKDRARYVVDLTADQVESLQHYEVLCRPHDELVERLNLDYEAKHFRIDPVGLSSDLVQKRLSILKDNLENPPSAD